MRISGNQATSLAQLSVSTDTPAVVDVQAILVGAHVAPSRMNDVVDIVRQHRSQAASDVDGAAAAIAAAIFALRAPHPSTAALFPAGRDVVVVDLQTTGHSTGGTVHPWGPCHGASVQHANAQRTLTFHKHDDGSVRVQGPWSRVGDSNTYARVDADTGRFEYSNQTGVSADRWQGHVDGEVVRFTHQGRHDVSAMNSSGRYENRVGFNDLKLVGDRFGPGRDANNDVEAGIVKGWAAAGGFKKLGLAVDLGDGGGKGVHDVNGVKVQGFAGGVVYQRPGEDPKAIGGAFANAWLAAGGANALGFPTGEPKHSPIGTVQTFERGYVVDAGGTASARTTDLAADIAAQGNARTRLVERIAAGEIDARALIAAAVALKPRLFKNNSELIGQPYVKAEAPRGIAILKAEAKDREYNVERRTPARIMIAINSDEVVTIEIDREYGGPRGSRDLRGEIRLEDMVRQLG